MAFLGRRVFGLIPARGGSKGIPRKNLMAVAGLSLVGHAARLALSLSWLDAVVLSTEDEEIAEEGRRHGLAVPFMRPADLAQDHSHSVDVWQHAWTQAEQREGHPFEASILLQPTSPLRTVEDVERALRTMLEGSYLSAVTVGQTPSHFAPEKLLVREEGEQVRGYLGSPDETALRQRARPYHHRDGICYAATRECVMDRGEIIGDDCVGVMIDRPLINIDTMDELIFADWLLSQQSSDFYLTGVRSLADALRTTT